MKNAKYLPALLIAILAGLSSCEPEETSIRLTSSERIRIDSLAKKQIDTLAPFIDSLCTVQHDDMVQQALDSIIALRKAEEQKLRARLKQKQ